MAGAANVTTDTSVLSRLDQQLLKAERVLALCSGLAVFGLMVLAVVSVSGRNFFNAPVPGYVDYIEQAKSITKAADDMRALALEAGMSNIGLDLS